MTSAITAWLSRKPRGDKTAGVVPLIEAAVARERAACAVLALEVADRLYDSQRVDEYVGAEAVRFAISERGKTP